MKPQVLDANQPADRFYAGGRRIAEFRGVPSTGRNIPEDWVASTTTLFGEVSEGLSYLPDGRLLLGAVRADPEAWLGPDHVRAFGDDTSLLVKLLDAGQRLPVHVHPGIAFAEKHLGLVHGKTEAWVFLEPATVHVAFERDVGEDELALWVDEQDVKAMLGAMHSLPVERGDAVLIPAGMPHAIGEGAFLVELQEPTDLSILMEWTGFDIDGAKHGHLGLGFETDVRSIEVPGRGRQLKHCAARVPDRQVTCCQTQPTSSGSNAPEAASNGRPATQYWSSSTASVAYGRAVLRPSRCGPARL